MKDNKEELRNNENKSSIYSMYLTVLDLQDGRVYQYRIKGLTADDHELTENFMKLEGHVVKDCHYMVHGPTHVSGPHLIKEYNN